MKFSGIYILYLKVSKTLVSVKTNIHFWHQIRQYCFNIIVFFCIDLVEFQIETNVSNEENVFRFAEFLHIGVAYTFKSYKHNFHANTFSCENRMKIMRVSCKTVIHVYTAKIIYNLYVKIMRLTCDFHTY